MVLCGSRDKARRHLDSWLMQPGICRDLFTHGARSSDFALVEGQYDVVDGESSAGGSLDKLCQWLDLPQIAIVNVQDLQPCRLLRLPPGVDGLLLDGIRDTQHLCHVQTELEANHGVPVLGALEEISESARWFSMFRREAPRRMTCATRLGTNCIGTCV